MDWSFLDNRYVIALLWSAGGVLATLLTQQILNRRAVFTYFVRHSRVGVSADDAVFGSVRVTWNGNPVANLYSSTVEFVNQSMKDFNEVRVRAYTNDTILLNERTEVVGTSHIVRWTDDFQKQIQVPPGAQATPTQIDLYSHQREYQVPVMNRGQVIRLHFLNAAKTPNQPSIWLDVVHKGVKLKFEVPRSEVFGVPQPAAALVGALLGFLFVGFLIVLIESLWVATLAALIYGFFAKVPGAYAIRFWRWLKDWFGG